MALGANRGEVVRMVMREAGTLLAAVWSSASSGGGRDAVRERAAVRAAAARSGDAGDRGGGLAAWSCCAS